MRDQAHVQSPKALTEARNSVVEFVEVVRATFASVESDINRVDQWLTHERPAHWKREIRLREDAVQRAKLEIERKRLIRAPEPASVVFEQRQLAKARERVESARKRQEATQRWAVAFQKQAQMAKSASRDLSDAVSVNLPRAVALLERMTASLEAYLAVRNRVQAEGDLVIPDEDPEQTPGAAPEEPKA
ncbi:MAG: hypothetical protein ACOYN0_03940 [Phycisphaerales bacterium]